MKLNSRILQRVSIEGAKHGGSLYEPSSTCIAGRVLKAWGRACPKAVLNVQEAAWLVVQWQFEDAYNLS